MYLSIEWELKYGFPKERVSLEEQEEERHNFKAWPKVLFRQRQ